MKKGFPHKFLGFAIGWSNLGKYPSWHDGDYIMKWNCGYCRTRIRRGREDGKVFSYCPLCEEKVTLTKK